MCAWVVHKPASAFVLSVNGDKASTKLFICFGGDGSTFASVESFYRLVSHQWAALTALIPSIETNESVAGADCTAFKGIHSVSFMLVISVKNRKLFSHLIHIIDKMRN